MGDEGGTEASDSMGEEGLRVMLAVVQGVEHGGVGAEVTAPAHTYGGEYGDGIAVDPALLGKAGHNAESSPYGSECCNGDRYLVGIAEAKEPLEEEVHLRGQPRKQLHPFLGTARIAASSRSEGEQHHQCGDDEHARDDGQTDIDARASSVE